MIVRRVKLLAVTSVLASLALVPSGTVLAAKGKKPAGATPAKAASTGAGPSATLERALKLYDSKEYEGASIELFKVVQGESGDKEPDQQKAQFFMGKTLYNMKYLSASLSFFDQVVEK